LGGCHSPWQPPHHQVRSSVWTFR